MNVTNYNYGIKFSDLVDINNPNTTYEMIENKINEVLTVNCKRNYFIEDDVLWNDFIKRFTTRYIFRTLSFDTYMNFFIKLNQIFLDNRIILERMYETKMIEFNPLYSIYKEIKDDNTTNEEFKGDKQENEHVKDEDGGEDTIHHGGEDILRNRGNDTNYKEGYDEDYKSGRDSYHNGKTGTNTITDNNYTLNSDAPRSTVEISAMFETENNYITSGINNQNSRVETPLLNDDGYNDYNSSVKRDYNSDNKVEYNSDKITEYNNDIKTTHGKNKTVDKTNGVLTDNKKGIIFDGKTLIEGYENYPVELLEKYLDFVIDCNEYLLSEIDKNHLFMDIII